VLTKTQTRNDTQGLALRVDFVNPGETPIALEGQTMTTFFFTLTTVKGYYRTVPVSARGLSMALDTISNMYPRAAIITITF
jgi:hypothetical protein